MNYKYKLLHRQWQFTFLWLLGNDDEIYGVIYEVDPGP